MTRSPLRLLRRAVRAWRTSLRVKVIGSTIAVALVALVLVGTVMSATIRDGIFDQRVNTLLLESSRSASIAQSTFNASTASNGTQVQQLLNDMMSALQPGGSSDHDIFLWRSLEAGPASISVNDISTAPERGSTISDRLRAAVVGGGDEQHWQSVAIPVAGGTEPGVIVGSTVEVPVAGTFELYFLYSLAPEQQTLTFIQQVLAISSVLLVGLLGAVTWLVTRQVVRPITQAASVAERLADGHLDERLEVRGHDEVATLGSSFNAMAASLQDQIEQLAALSDVQRRFVSDVSHELRTPLTTVRMASDLIYDSRATLPPALGRSAELLAMQLDRFQSLLDDLLEISRFDAGAAILDAERHDVRALVEHTVDGMTPLSELKGVPVLVDLGEREATADIDQVRVERILRNLVANAIEHADGTVVEVTVRADHRAVAVRVRDHGVGLTREQATHVFDRFWRGDPARARTTGGTGLGLSIAQEDALLHGGRLEAWGRPQHGAAFMLTLPRRAGMPLTSSPMTITGSNVEKAAAFLASVGSAPTGGSHGPATIPDLADPEEQP